MIYALLLGALCGLFGIAWRGKKGRLPDPVASNIKGSVDVSRLSRTTRAASPAPPVASKGLVDVSRLRSELVLADPPNGAMIEFNVFNQGGTLVRQHQLSKASDAILELERLFSRMGEQQAPIWTNSAYHCDVRRGFGNFRGRKESRKIWGVDLRVVGVR